jgi:hypothetical protein
MSQKPRETHLADRFGIDDVREGRRRLRIIDDVLWKAVIRHVSVFGGKVAFVICPALHMNCPLSACSCAALCRLPKTMVDASKPLSSADDEDLRVIDPQIMRRFRLQDPAARAQHLKRRQGIRIVGAHRAMTR